MGQWCFKNLIQKKGKDNMPKDIPKDLWGLEVQDILGNNKILAEYREDNKVFLFLNVASK